MATILKTNEHFIFKLLKIKVWLLLLEETVA